MESDWKQGGCIIIYDKVYFTQRKLEIIACVQYKLSSNKGLVPSAVKGNKGPAGYWRKNGYHQCQTVPLLGCQQEPFAGTLDDKGHRS